MHIDFQTWDIRLENSPETLFIGLCLVLFSTTVLVALERVPYMNSRNYTSSALQVVGGKELIMLWL